MALYADKMRNFWLTIIGMVLAFAAWCLAGALGWPNVEWVVMTILGVAGVSGIRALGDYRRTDTGTETRQSVLSDLADLMARSDTPPRTDNPPIVAVSAPAPLPNSDSTDDQLTIP